MSDTKDRAAALCRANHEHRTVRIESRAAYYQLAHAAFAEVVRRGDGDPWLAAESLVASGWQPSGWP